MVSDEELVRWHLGGNESALNTLLERYQRPIWTYAQRQSNCQDDQFIDDIRQQVLIAIFKGLKEHGFEPAGPGSFRAWVHQVIKHTCINANKRLNRQPEPISQLYPDEVPDPPDERTIEPDEDIIRDDRAERVLARLSDEDRLLLQLVIVEHKSYEEITQMKPFERYQGDLPALRQRTCRLRRTLIELYRTK